MPDSTTVDLINGLPCWQGRIEISPLAGGMTNRNFLVADANAGRFVVRIGRDLPEHGVMRFNELAHARAAHRIGISPEVVFAMDGLMMSRFIDGRPLAVEDIRNPQHFEAILDLIQRCHVKVPRVFRGPALAFWVLQVIRNYLATLDEASNHFLADHLRRLETMSEALERATGPITLVFGHNDLLAANFLDDGQRLWLIDWDYAGFKSPLVDLANLSSNNGFDATRDDQLLARYFGARGDAVRRHAFEAFKCASLLREALWGAVSERRSSIDFDYATYSREYLLRLDLAWELFLANGNR
jgi:thiamine kinase-like enzyme